jgi:transposase
LESFDQPHDRVRAIRSGQVSIESVEKLGWEQILFAVTIPCRATGYLQGGTTPMMGQQNRSDSLFYYFRLEEQIPADHLLRMIDGHVDFRFVREQLKDFYSSTGRPSIDPEVLLRLLLVGYLYGITSERRLMDEVRMHLAYRWFTRLGFDQEIPDHSTLSKNRHGRFRQSGVFRKVFEEIVRRCLEAGFVEGRNVAVDGTLVGANASQQSRVPREKWRRRKSPERFRSI